MRYKKRNTTKKTRFELQAILNFWFLSLTKSSRSPRPNVNTYTHPSSMSTSPHIRSKSPTSLVFIQFSFLAPTHSFKTHYLGPFLIVLKWILNANKVRHKPPCTFRPYFLYSDLLHLLTHDAPDGPSHYLLGTVPYSGLLL